MSATKGVSYDRAARTYDAARPTPPDVERRACLALARALALAPGDITLEVAVGTGRVAAPLAATTGVRAAGVDLSRGMLERAREKGLRHLAQAEATALPARDGSVRAVLFVHALHVITGWREALAEARRVVTPVGATPRSAERGGATIVISMGGLNEIDTPWALMRDELRRAGASAGIQALHHPGATGAEVVAEMARAGWSRRVVEGARWRRAWSPREFLDGIRSGAYSTTWDWAPDVQARVLSELEAFAVKTWGSADRVIERDEAIVWDVYASNVSRGNAE